MRVSIHVIQKVKIDNWSITIYDLRFTIYDLPFTILGIRDFENFLHHLC